MNTLELFLLSLEHAKRNHMPASVGGGEFSPEELGEVVKAVRDMQTTISRDAPSGEVSV